MGIPIFDGIEKLINEHGSAVILKERIDLAKDQYAALEKQSKESFESLATARARLEIEVGEHGKTKVELAKLKAEHEEEVRIFKAIEFRKGKRTGGRWIGFCPKCHAPAYGWPQAREGLTRTICSASCDWEIFDQSTLERLTAQVT